MKRQRADDDDDDDVDNDTQTGQAVATAPDSTTAHTAASSAAPSASSAAANGDLAPSPLSASAQQAPTVQHNGHATPSASTASGASAAGAMEQQRRIPPSLFGVRPHSDVTMQVGQFLKSAIRSAQQAKVSSQSREPRFTAQQIEIEVKLGMVLDKQSRRRISLPILSETVIDSSGSYFSFSSNMSRNQHATLNQKLNAATVRPGSGIRYVHLREEDLFYTIRGIGKVRKTVTKGTQQVKCIISKMGVANLEVFLPTSALDYRVSVNLERHLSDIESIYQPEFVRGKDRLSYTMSPFQVDLTQVRAADQGYGSSFGSGDEMLHEVEVEVTRPELLIAEMERDDRQEPNVYLDLVDALLNNVRLLIRKSVPR